MASVRIAISSVAAKITIPAHRRARAARGRDPRSMMHRTPRLQANYDPMDLAV